ISLTLRWHPSAGASSYRVQVASSGDFTETAFYRTGIADTTVDISLPDQGQYVWRVAGEDGSGPSAYSNPRSFSTSALVPALVRPANGSSDQLISVILKWRHVTGVDAYHLQVANDALFSSIVLDEPALADTAHLLSELNFLTTYYWRVDASL